MKTVDVILAGAGGRGTNYTDCSFDDAKFRVVGVAEPREFYRNRVVKKHGIPPENVFTDWRAMAERPKFADAVIIATQDSMHAEPAIAFAKKKYGILLEKPMAPNEQDCRAIFDAVVENDIIFGVCHVMRYTLYTQELKRILDAGTIGEIVSVQHLEPVGYWHQAHSFVRGNWRNEALSSFMLLSKSCHDIDWIHYLMGVKCKSVSSFGTLRHFRKEGKPSGAGARCVECGVESHCPYSALKIYLRRAGETQFQWPVDVITTELTQEGVLRALRDGPYGRCVYECDNDVVDHQVVNFLFEGGQTASFTMTAFTEQRDRNTRIFGTRGEISANGSQIEIYDFMTDKRSTVNVSTLAGNITGGHGGGDPRLMHSFISAVATGDRSKILSGPQETLESHQIVFAAEKARCENRVVDI